MTDMWTEATIQVVLKKPQTLLATEPWKTWIARQGGLSALYATFAALPLPAQERQVFTLLLDQPGLTNQQYAVMLSMHRVTFQRTLRRLVGTLTAHFAAQRLDASSPAPPPPFPASERHGSIPTPLTALIGRSEEVAAICTLLHNPTTRLLTLVGTGGIGKTRLAIQIAAEIRADYTDGVVFVALTPIADSALVMPAIAQALGLIDDGSQDLMGQVHRYCNPRHMCLVIDNAEHVLDAALAFTALLSQAPRLTIMVTSRVRLDLYGEHVISVPTLALPPRETTMPFEQLCTFDALRLFAARAQAVDQTFQLEPDNISLVDAICRQLDGLPLAIELAASHLRHYPLREILTRLEHRLAFLNNGPRDVIPRHQTLLATIGWSETLLGPTARQVFRRLSVLVDGWTPEALAAVCSLTEAEGQAILHTLLDHHLVYRLHPTSDEHRFGMLEMIREYALHQLHNAGEEAAIRTRHLAYYIQFVEPIEGYLGGEHQLRWLDSLTAAYPNIRAALAWTLAAELVEAGVQLGGALCRYWELTSQYLEGRDWIERVLAQAGAEANTCHYARAIQALARTYITKPAQAIPITQRALEAIRQTDDIWRTASILSDQGRNWWGVGEFARAEEYCLQSLALRRQIGDQGEIGSSLLNLGTLAFNQADFSKAVRFYQEGLALFRRVGDLNGIAMMLNNLGAVARERGDYARAEQTLREALVVRTQIGVVGGIVMTTVNLAWVSAAQANTQLARQYLREALRLAADVKEEVALDWFMEVFVRIRLAENAIESAMEWYGAAQYEALRGEVPYDQLTLAWYSATLSAAEEQLGNERVAAAIQRGHVLAESQSLAAMLKHLQDAVG